MTVRVDLGYVGSPHRNQRERSYFGGSDLGSASGHNHKPNSLDAWEAGSVVPLKLSLEAVRRGLLRDHAAAPRENPGIGKFPAQTRGAVFPSEF